MNATDIEGWTELSMLSTCPLYCLNEMDLISEFVNQVFLRDIIKSVVKYGFSCIFIYANPYLYIDFIE